MVGGAVLAGVALAGARMFKDQKVAQKGIENEQNLMAYHNSLVKLMHNENNCNATMTSYFGATGAAAWGAPAALYSCTGCTSTSTNYNAGNVTGGMKTVQATAGTWIDGTQTWRVSSFAIGKSGEDMASAPGSTGRAVLRVTYEYNPNLPKGGKKVSKDINLSLRFTQAATPVFLECISGGESSVNNLSHDICSDAMKAGQVTTDGRIMVWNDSLQTCVLTSPANTGQVLKSCPPGSVIEGVRNDGTVTCKALSNGITPGQDLMLQNTCPAGSNVRLEIVDGKVKTLCQ